MNHKRKLRVCIATFVLSVALVLTSTLLAHAGGTPNLLSTLVDIPFWSVDGGGGSSSGGNYTLTGDIGQPDAGTLNGGTYTIDGGFLGGASTRRSIFVPLLQR